MFSQVPSRRRLTVALLASSLLAFLSAADSRENWIEVRSPNFLVATNAGEKQARRIAKQFEQIRSVYHEAFPQLRLDLGKPVIIIAAKNETSMKALLPAYWEQKGRVHPAGIYVAGEEKHYVLLQADAPGENPYHTLYHEYTHAIMHVNFPPLPLWLDEAFAEFYGNTLIDDHDFKLGKVEISHLQLLQQSKLIPVEVLLQVDHSSPYYNEENRASVFYAECWALLHYLLMDPDARKQQLLTHFLQTWSKSGNQVEAARQTFGDLKKFGQTIEGYARQQQFYMATMKSSIQADEKAYELRPLSSAESLARRGDFHLHMQRLIEARAMLEEAIKQDETMALAHESLGIYHFLQHDIESAAKELQRATELNSQSFLTYFYSAMLNLQLAKGTPGEWPKAEATLEKAIALNRNFAPAFANLAQLYLLRGDQQEKALSAARRAVELEPGTLSYSLNLGYILLNSGRTDEARALAARIVSAAKTPAELSSAKAFESNIEATTTLRVQMRSAGAQNGSAVPDDAEEETSAISGGTEAGALEKTSASASKGPAAPAVTHKFAAGAIPDSSASAQPAAVTDARTYEMTGNVTALDCSRAPEVTLTLTFSSIAMKLHAADLGKVAVNGAARATKSSAATCASWKGRSARTSYHLTPGKPFDGELVSIQLF